MKGSCLLFLRYINCNDADLETLASCNLVFNSTSRTCSSTCSTVQTCIRIDFEVRVPLRNSSCRAVTSA